MSRIYDWEFPLPRTHTGMLQGNGTLGAIIWGEGSVLRVTLGRADFWDHRGGLPWREGMSFQAIRRLLEAGDEKGLRAIFETTPQGAGIPPRPTVLPVGRIDLDFGVGATLRHGALDLDTGVATVLVEAAGRICEVRIVMAMDRPVVALDLGPDLPQVQVKCLPAWEFLGDELRKVGFVPPELLTGTGLGGWVQAQPADPALCVGFRRKESELTITAIYGADTKAATTAASRELDQAEAAGGGFGQVRATAGVWWSNYWRKIPGITVPNPRLQFLYDYGMYKFAGLTNPTGVAATLQGPWIEEYRLPPWSSDYHFNINVQMCYWPAYHGNCLEHLLPLFRLVKSWTPVLRENARIFLGITDGLMLPHAVDDRCTCMGGFWTGSVDHACTGWVAQMMYRYFRYTMDLDFLRDTAYPFMVGAMRVYEGMLEKNGNAFVLPVSVSPEYRGSAMNAWGRNASFQLACIHRLCADLIEAAPLVGEVPRPVWLEIQAKLPRASLVGTAGRQHIGLWEGLQLEESHRHHSHLAGIVPFDVFPDDPAWHGIVARSLDEWVWKGMGQWSGWCVPWAAMIHTRQNNGDAAEILLELFGRIFTNMGHGTLHDVDFPGIIGMGRTYENPAGRGDIMQLDGGMSCTAAIQELFLHTRGRVNHVFTGIPRTWKHAAFGPMRTDGAFLVSGSYESGRPARIAVQSPAGGVFCLANPWGGEVQVCRGTQCERLTGPVLAIPTQPGESFELTAGLGKGE